MPRSSRTGAAVPGWGAASAVHVLGCAAVGVLVAGHLVHLPVWLIPTATAVLVAMLMRAGLSFREHRRLLERTRQDAATDLLTGLANRRSFVADLEGCLAEATSDDGWALVVFDLDGFKGYNDTFGHPAGDTLLARIGAKLAAVPGVGGAAYRLGGDEFCVLSPVASVAEAAALIDRSLAALTEQGEGFAVTSSFGVVLIPYDADDVGHALRLADERLYLQKRGKQTERDRPHEMLLAALYERDPGIQGHLEGVASLAIEVGKAMGLQERALIELHRAAQLHDVGTIAVPDDILLKPGPLDDDEWRFVQQHTVVGERILSASPVLRDVGRIVRSTHERYDGGGYPDGLSGEAIPLAARIVFVCHAFDAMVEPRSFRPALTAAEALAELDRNAGTQFDPAIVAVVASVVQRRLAAAAA